MSFLKKWELLLAFYLIPMIIIVFNGFTGMAPQLSSTVTKWATTIAAAAIFFGGILTMRFHYTRVSKRQKGTEYSIVLIVAVITILLLSITNKTSYDWIINNVLKTLSTAILSLQPFWGLIAFYKGSRARSLEAGVLLVTSIIVMLRNAPIGEALWSGIPLIGSWIESYPSNGVMAALWVMFAVGSIALIVRIILGHERRVLGGT